MAVARRVLRRVLLTVAGLAALAVGAVAVLTRTDFGVERTGRFVLERLEGSIHGSLTVGDFSSGGLLRGVTLHAVALTDTAGRPFVRADSVRLAYRLRTLLGGSLVFDRLVLYGPDVTVEQLPGQRRWNYQRILADTATAGAPDATAVESLILIRDATIHGGRVRVRQPWPDSDADTSRLLSERVPGGRVRTLRFDDVEARLPRVVWQAPGGDGRVLEIADLSTRAHIWETPIELESLRGVVTIRDSVIQIEAEQARLPESTLSAHGRLVVGPEGNRYDFEAVGESVAFRDFRWLYPRLPADGGGSLRLRMQTQEPGTILFLAEEMQLRTRGNELAGSFGVVTGDRLRLTGVNVRAAPLDLELLAGLFPDAPPLSGLVIGRVEAEGPLTALRTAGDVRYRTFAGDGSGAESAIRWNGVVGGEPPYRLRNMEAELRSVELAQVAQFAPKLQLRGTARGRVRADGSIENGLQVQGSVSLTHGGRRSAIEGSGRFALGSTPTFDLQFDAQPLALELVAAQVPALEGLRGEARGPVTVAGSVDDLTVAVDLTTPAGAVVARGQLNLVEARPRYRAEGSVRAFHLDRVVSDLPETVVTARFEGDGSGLELQSAVGELSLDVLSAEVQGVEVYGGALRASLTDGLARVDSFSVSTEVGDADARGAFGLLEGRDGELAVNVRADSLVFLEPLLFNGAPPPDLGFGRAARIDGRIDVAARVNGSVARWRADGTVRARSLLYDELELGRGNMAVAWDSDSLSIVVSLDSLRYGHRRLAAVQGAGTYARGQGVVSVDARGRRGQQLELESAFKPEGEVVSLGLRSLRLTTRDGVWELADTARATVGGSGFQVDSMVLNHGPAPARIRVAGVLPWRQREADEVQEASLEVDLDSVRISEFLRVTQTDTLADGIVTGSFRVTGVARAPRLEGRVYARAFRYGGAVLDSVRGEVGYESRRLAGGFTGWSAGVPILTGRVGVPVDLALTDEEDRLLDEPMELRFRADNVPAGLLGFLASGFRGLDGRVDGEVAVVGTPVAPDVQGTLRLASGSAFYQPLAVGYRNIEATAKMVAGPGVDLDARLNTQSGGGRIQGTLDLTEPGDPVLDLRVNAERLDAIRRRDVTAVVNGTARLRGRYSQPVISGDLRVVRGELNLDEILRQNQIVQLDTTLFRMLDTTQVAYRPEPESPFLRNLRVTNTTLRTERNVWIRSQELNVEVGGSLALEVDRRSDDLRLTGTLQVLEGDYRLLARSVPGGRRFEIRSGTIEFVGTPGIDPNLNIDAAYRVRRSQGEPINVLASVTGTLQDPRVELSSDAEIPLSETDLASYILFGRPSSELTQAEFDVASGGSLAVGLFRPVISGVASSGIQQVAASLGLPVDYVSFTLPEYGFTEYGAAYGAAGAAGLFQNAQIEVGFDPVPNISVIGSVRIPGADARDDRPSALRLFGARVEYRPWPTWTVEGFIEDQFARTPSFGTAEISDRKVLGLSLFREWGY